MKSICFYFQVHQPYRLRGDYSFFKIGPDHDYEDEDTNRAIIQKVAKKCYLPTNKILLNLLRKHRGNFKISFSISGVALEQFEKYAPEVIESFQKLVKTGYVELLSETYYHSLAILKSRDEFVEQVQMHNDKIFELFGVRPKVFRNTELIYSNYVAEQVANLGYSGILSEGADVILGARSPNFLYQACNTDNLKVLMKNYKLSDDIAFRFSNKGWKEYPLTPKKYTKWLFENLTNSDVVNLFMDYETFGEHQWEETGIFKFLRKLPNEILKTGIINFKTPSEVINDLPTKDIVDSPGYTSWADEDRSLTAWLGNDMQKSAFDFVYSLEKPIKMVGDKNLIHQWRKLQTSDHHYYVSTKWANDGAVHSYFSPYRSPHDAFIVYMNVINDLKLSLLEKGAQI